MFSRWEKSVASPEPMVPAMLTPADLIMSAIDAPTRRERRLNAAEYVRLTGDYAPSAREVWERRSH